MRQIALLGASSQLARDLIRSMAPAGHAHLQLYVRDRVGAERWLEEAKLPGSCSIHSYEEYGALAHEAVINFVGVGDPQRAAQLGAGIFGLTQHFDDLVLAGLEGHPERRYVFLSSGAAYGSTFLEPAGPDTRAVISINALQPQEYYSVAKLHAECKHRARTGLSITDVRVFNYFSRTQDLAARFFITDLLRAIRDGRTLQTSPDSMVRDFLHPGDFHQLIDRILEAPPQNQVLDCYTRAPIDKVTLLATMQQHFGLQYEVVAAAPTVNATGAKPHYYSLNRQAAAIGYQPAFSSLDGILLESAAILGRVPGQRS